ncbi:MAG: chemotaxis protein CheB [Pseudomonadota bacterium]
MAQTESKIDTFRAALLYEDESFQEPLKAAVAAAGGTVTTELRLSEFENADQVSEGVLIVNLERPILRNPEILERVFAYPGRLILNDSEASSRLTGPARARWARHLAAKITGSGQVYPAVPEHEQARVEEAVQIDAAAPREVWVLAASIGGPEAMRTFLGEMMPDVPFCLVLAQHIGKEFINLMTEQLDQASRLSVKMAIDDEPFRPGRVYVVPPDKCFEVNDDDRIKLTDMGEDRHYSPDINQVIHGVVDRYGAKANVIVFSGMASDAVEGCGRVLESGGQVWVQERDTCVVSSMVDGAIALGGVEFQADPLHLAHRLNQRGIEKH